MKKFFALFLIVLSVTGCATNDDFAYSSTDAMFAEMMIPHHEQAIVMSDLAITRSTNPEIIALASKIKFEQAPEIEIMRNWKDEDASMHAGHEMMGMLSEKELQALANSFGKTFDKLFLKGMIKHHEGAIQMAEMILDSANNEVANLGKSIVKTQKDEIEEMKNLLNS
jgi:uncharacterized protein (DUF305 family)